MSIISILMLAAFVIIYFTTSNNVETENRNKLELLYSKPNIAFPNLPEDTKQNKIITGGILSDFSFSFNIFVDLDGNIIKVISNTDMPEEIYFKATELAWNEKKDHSIISIEDKRWQYKIFPMNRTFVTREKGKQSIINFNDNNYQIIFLDVTDSHKTLTELLTTLFFVGIIMLFVIFTISLFFASRSIRPISEAWEKQKQFIADASHELKTPLAIINANSDALLANQDETIKSQKKWLDYIKTQIDRMGKLVNDLLYLAKTEDINSRMIEIPFDISEVVNDVILSMETVAFEKDIMLLQEVEENIIIKSDCEKIKQVVTILLDNAIKYTDEKGCIDIVLKKTRHQLVFSIKNSGKGISKENLPKLFDRFYRTDPARTQENGGYGLGLSIAKVIIDRLYGEIYADSVKDECTTFTFTLGL